MAEDKTSRFALPLLLAGQAQKEVTHNEALARIDIVAAAAVESADLVTPPAVPVAGQCWIVAAGASGAWDGHGGEIAGWTDGGWRFVEPARGMDAWVADRGHAVRWNGSDWSETQVRANGFYQDGVKVLGAQGGAITAPTGGAVIDVECRIAVGAILDMLRAHGMIVTST